MLKKLKSLFIFSLITFSLFLLTGCGSENSATETEKIFCEVHDDAGRTVTLAKKPERIVSTSASFLEPLESVGGKVVGRPSSKNLPDFAKDAADIGPVYQIDTEKLLACTPDLVLINKGMNEKLSAILDENKIPYLVVNMKTYDSVKKNVEMFAELTGEPERGKNLVAEMDAKIASIVEKIPHEKKRVAILHSTAQNLSVQLSSSIAGNVLTILGWENVASGEVADDDKDSVPYSLEFLVAQNPEIIFVTSMGNIAEIQANFEKMLAENSAWQSIPAVRENKIYYLPQDLFLLSPGIHYPAAVAEMAEKIYPGAAQ